MLRLDDRWMWDFWLARDGPEHHVFYLQAPRRSATRTCDTPMRRSGTPCRPTSRSWEVLPDAMVPGPPGPGTT